MSSVKNGWKREIIWLAHENTIKCPIDRCMNQ